MARWMTEWMAERQARRQTGRLACSPPGGRVGNWSAGLGAKNPEDWGPGYDGPWSASVWFWWCWGKGSTFGCWT